MTFLHQFQSFSKDFQECVQLFTSLPETMFLGYRNLFKQPFNEIHECSHSTIHVCIVTIKYISH